MRHVPEIKLIRTDTTLDLSQKAEKVCLGFGAGSHLKAAEAQFRSGRGAPQYLARKYALSSDFRVQVPEAKRSWKK